MISQRVDGQLHWTTVQLRETTQAVHGTLIAGSWKHTNGSHDGSLIKFTSDNEQYLYWLYNGGPNGGVLQIGSKMGRASHKAGEDEIFHVFIRCFMMRRDAQGHFHGSGDHDGEGLLTYNVNPHFVKGAFGWSVVRY
jgi:hypothetical protein